MTEPSPVRSSVRALDLLLPERCAICDCARTRALRSLSALASALASRLRALRLAGAVAGPTVRRVRREEARLRRRRVRRSSTTRRRDAFVRSWKERGRRRLAREAAALVAEIVPRPSVDAPRPRAGRSGACVAPGDVPSRALAHELGRIWNLRSLERSSGAAHFLGSVASRSERRRERPRERRRARGRPLARVRRRRRLHVRRDRGRLRERVPTSRRSARRA